MPNWVTNHLYARSKKIDLKKSLAPFMESEGSETIDFNKIVPMPDELNGEGNLPHDPDEKTANLWAERRKKYGASNWYDWSVKNWGTKWNAGESYFDDEKRQMVFQTAWDQPKPIIQKLADTLGVTIGNRYHDEYDNKYHTAVYKPKGGRK